MFMLQEKRITAALHRMSSSDVASMKRCPSVLKRSNLVEPNRVNDYLDELGKRTETKEEEHRDG